MRATALSWSKTGNGGWYDLIAIDLDSPYFKGLEGVYFLWHGGKQPEPLKVGGGPIGVRLGAERKDPAVLAYREQGLYATWARVEAPDLEGVQRFLAESLQPKFKGPPLAAPAIEVNLPGRAAPAGIKPAAASAAPATAAPTVWEDLASAKPIAPPVHEDAPQAREPNAISPSLLSPGAPKAGAPTTEAHVSDLQRRFAEFMDKISREAAASGGFFSGQKPKKEEEALVGEVVQMILEEAIRSKASDIHIEPMGKILRVRFRVDGIMEQVLAIPKGLNLRLVSHIRVQSGLDPEQSLATGKPQDGRMAVTVDGKESDLRLSTFPTAYGDKAVLRVIPHSETTLRLEDMGLGPKSLERLRRIIHLPQGMLIVTGPAGSGKSTTLYTALHSLNDVTRNIVTLEDPVELTIPGVTQGALQPKVGFTFAEGLRAILRQDPNVVMVGEIRDRETAEIAMSAALTGHMLFTTLHTTSALGAVARLFDMGLEPYLISSAVTAVCAQRLARKICPACREAFQPTGAEQVQIRELAARAELALAPEELKTFYRGKGCSTCRNTGYSGRILIFELIEMTSFTRELILRKATMNELRKFVLKECPETLLRDGLQKALTGVTTVEELARVVGSGE